MNNFELILTRIESNDSHTLGLLKHNGIDGVPPFELFTLELPWRENVVRKSCINVGRYKVVKRWSAKYKHHFWITNVSGRSMILIHAGNYVTDSLGCVLVGDSVRNGVVAGSKMLLNSKKSMRLLLDSCPDHFTLIIREAVEFDFLEVNEPLILSGFASAVRSKQS
jgi:hypothetical protein